MKIKDSLENLKIIFSIKIMVKYIMIQVLNDQTFESFNLNLQVGVKMWILGAVLSACF